MTNKELEEYLFFAELIIEEVCKTKESARAFLQKSGFCDEHGELNECYRD